MKLKRVRIFGFKTFADKTEFDLEGSIIAVVGPNGCGKSNIVDSILWGLGETNARSLRAQTSQEVIFSGSQTRKPLNYAEVSLLFDNEDGSLPIDTPDVSVSRRLTRSGESTYAINKRNCRLKDIGDLLADSGLGRAGYAIVTQSEIDQALAASAQQRRAWIDEAAGVMRYRIRRQEAIRRLENGRDTLSRVQDVIREIESQMAPLEGEAAVARRFKTLAAELRKVEVGLLAAELTDSVRDLEALAARSEETMRQIQAEALRLKALEDERGRLQEDMERLDGRIDALRQEAMDAQAAQERASSAVDMAKAKLESLAALESQMAEESGGAATRIELARSDLAEAQALAEAEARALLELKEAMASTDAEARRLSGELEQVERELAAAQQAAKEKQRREVERAHREERLSHIRLEVEGILRALPDLEAAIAEAKGSEKVHEDTLAEIRDAAKAAQSEMKALAQRLEAAVQTGRRLGNEAAAMEGRIRGLAATLEAHEGLAQGSRAVLAAAAQGMLGGSYTPVAEALTVNPEFALAIDTALGGAANDLIVPDERHAKAAIEVLKANRLGRATFQPLTLVRPSYGSDELHRLKREPGVVGIASDLVQCSREHQPVIESLLGRVLVVEDIDSGLKLARTRGWSRLVTLEGEVIHSSGAVTGGASKHQGAGMVQRRAELTELEQQLAVIHRDLEKSRKVVAGVDGERAKLTASYEASQKEAAAVQEEWEQARAWTMSIVHEKQAAERSLAKLEQERTSLTTEEPEGAAAGPSPAALQLQRDELMQALAVRQSDSQQSIARRQEQESRHSAAAQRQRECQRRVEILLEAEASRSRRSATLEGDRERAAQMIVEAEAKKVEAQAGCATKREELDLAIAARKTLVGEVQRSTEEAKKAQDAGAAFGETLHQTELHRAKAESRRAASIERLLEEYGIAAEEAAQIAEEAGELPADAASQVQRMRRELRSLGEVNLGAIEAFERLTERHAELSAQVEDVLAGQRDVEAGIKELDRLTRDRFVGTFKKLQAEFSAMFQRVFNGGEGQIELTNPEQILESGVDISVTIPGKRRQRLELLSGGERALSALAFLFALLKVKPSPLVVLDEVDAPLDGRNVERFIAMMRELSETTQFILITHNPVTIESADVWFGVTMQEPGVTTVVPFKAPAAPVPGGGEASLKG